MSRSRNVEPEAAIQAARALFWKHGFCGLGTRQIEQETGLTRFTLQTTYGGKKTLFLQILDSYLDFTSSGYLPVVEAGSLENLAQWFERRADPAMMPESGCYGCLMVNSIIEFHGQDAEVNQRKERFFGLLRENFRGHLENFFAGKEDVDTKAELLLGIVVGLNVIIRASNNNTAGKQLADSGAQMIRSWTDTR